MRNPWLVLLWVLHSCLEYVTGLIGWKKDLVELNLWSGGMWNSKAWLDFSYDNKSSFPLVFYVKMYLLICGFIFMLSFLFCWLHASYKHGLWQNLVMDLMMFLLVNEWMMNVWRNRCYCSYYEKALDLLGDFQISIRHLCSYVYL